MNDWNQKCCNMCGEGSTPYIDIRIATDADGEHPYSQTTMCRSCWDQFGISAAMIYNAECREAVEE